MPSARLHSATAQSSELQPSNTNRFLCRAAGSDSEKHQQSRLGRERMSHRFYYKYFNEIPQLLGSLSGLDTVTATIHSHNGLLRLSGFPESVGLNDHCGPQIQLKVITGATSSQTNNRVRPRPSFVIFFNPDDQINIRSPSGKLELQPDFWMISICINFFWMEISVFHISQ